MTSLSKGANTPIPVQDLVVELSWSGGLSTPDVDLSALLVTAEGTVRNDDDFVFYNAPRHASGAVELGTKGGSSAGVRVLLAQVEAAIERIVVVVSADGGTFSQVPGLSVSVSGADGQQVASFSDMGATVETALVAGEIYRRGGQWKFRAVGQGWDSGLAGLATDFGISVEGESSTGSGTSSPASGQAYGAQSAAPGSAAASAGATPATQSYGSASETNSPTPQAQPSTLSAPLPGTPPHSSTQQPQPPVDAPAVGQAPATPSPHENYGTYGQSPQSGSVTAPSTGQVPPPSSAYTQPPSAAQNYGTYGQQPPTQPSQPASPQANHDGTLPPPPATPPSPPAGGQTVGTSYPSAPSATPYGQQNPAQADQGAWGGPPQNSHPYGQAPTQTPSPAPQGAPSSGGQQPGGMPAPSQSTGVVNLDKGHVSLKKGERVSLTKTGAPPMSQVFMGLGWDPALRGRSIDLDASVIAFDGGGRKLEIVWFMHLREFNGAIVHQGDNLTGDGDGDDEVITINLQALPPQVVYLVFTINSFGGQKFTDVQNAYARLVDAGTKQELVRFPLTESQPATGVIMAALSRTPNNTWEMRAIGQFADGRTVKKLVKPAAAMLGFH